MRVPYTFYVKCDWVTYFPVIPVHMGKFYEFEIPHVKNPPVKKAEIPGGYPRQFSIGVCRQGSQTLTLFKGRKSRIDTLLKAQNQEMTPYLRETR